MTHTHFIYSNNNYPGAGLEAIINVLGFSWFFGLEGTLKVLVMEMVCLGYNPSDLFVFCRIAPSLPRVRRRGGRWRGSNITCSPTLLLLNFLVAGKKETAFLFIPVHRATFLGFSRFLIKK